MKHQSFLLTGQIKKAMDSKFNRDPFVGYTYKEIHDFFQDRIHMLPKAYLEFLQLMGRKSFFLDWFGLTFSLEELDSIRQSAENLLSRNNPLLSIRDDDFVFVMNQGYQFEFFNLKEGDNPPVYGFAEAVNQQKIEQISTSFSEYLERTLLWDEDLYDPLYTHSTYPPHVYKQEKKRQK